MGAEGTRRSTGTKGAQRKFLSTLHPNTILKPTLTLAPTPTLSLVLTLHLIKIEYWDRAGGGGNISYDW